MVRREMLIALAEKKYETSLEEQNQQKTGKGLQLGFWEESGPSTMASPSQLTSSSFPQSISFKLIG
ncbi:hypothetical protein GW7_00939 [Heterocephalus glaber]|uniref:Uncharacterized protein n=1 Tax=Heterocephalus glaber TaxID=10181 RepID=G5APK9_HETGA|nr:hypothetical protein GW7_00939 [Heterocephalus glaber]